MRASYERGTKPGAQSSMHSGQRHGLDYTPLFRFLLSKVGQDWDTIYSEAVARLDRPDPIFWLVARPQEQRHRIVRIGESSYYNGLFVTTGGVLDVVDPSITIERLQPQCACCTHTFNGKVVPRPFMGDGQPLIAPHSVDTSGS